MNNNEILKHAIDRGTPFYVFDRQGFIDNYKRLDDTFKAVYPSYQISYSYKTNYTPYICNLVKELGGYAEVVSDMEYELAKRLGYDATQIVYNGPEKGDFLYEHLENKGILNVDNLDELKRIVAYCQASPHKEYQIGLRINMDIASSFISRFGFEEDSEEFKQCLNDIRNCDNLRLAGLHCHISRARGLDAWSRRAEKMIRVADKIFKDEIPEYISLGSGMYGAMSYELSSQFGDNIPSYSDYADAVFAPFANRYKGEKKPVVFTEPGTTLVSRYISFVTEVRNIRGIRGRNLATLDGSFHNLGEICELKKLPFEILKRGDGRICNGVIDLAGYTCLEQDVLYPEYSGELRIGDILCFENVGGYSIVSKPPFIRPNCPMYAISGDGGVKRIMRAETYDDVFGKFSL